MFLIEYICDKYGFNEFEANGYIMAGRVLVNEEICSWIKYKIRKDDVIRIKQKKSNYVTRSGYKLEKAINVFQVDVLGKIALDIGASEGGFTDCLLKHGAKKVYAVDVAYGILNYKLREDSRVVVIERKNARYLTDKEIPESVDLITSDVSFISLTKVIPNNIKFLKKNGIVILLFKPQFELDVKDLGKNGIPRDQRNVILKLEEFIMQMSMAGLYINSIVKSPLKGNSGNTEYLLWGGKAELKEIDRSQIENCVLNS